MAETKDLFEDRYVHIWHVQDHNYIEYRFKKFVPNRTFMDSLDKIYNYCRELSCHKILSDLREMKVIPQEAQQWMETDWVPRMLKQGLRSAAMVIPSSAIASRSVKTVAADDKLEENIGKAGVRVEHFASINKARAFLASSSN